MKWQGLSAEKEKTTKRTKQKFWNEKINYVKLKNPHGIHSLIKITEERDSEFKIDTMIDRIYPF